MLCSLGQALLQPTIRQFHQQKAKVSLWVISAEFRFIVVFANGIAHVLFLGCLVRLSRMPFSGGCVVIGLVGCSPKVIIRLELHFTYSCRSNFVHASLLLFVWRLRNLFSSDTFHFVRREQLSLGDGYLRKLLAISLSSDANYICKSGRSSCVQQRRYNFCKHMEMCWTSRVLRGHRTQLMVIHRD